MARRVKSVDVHSHVLPREMVEAIRAHPRDYQMRVETRDGGETFVRDDQHSHDASNDNWARALLRSRGSHTIADRRLQRERAAEADPRVQEAYLGSVE